MKEKKTKTKKETPKTYKYKLEIHVNGQVFETIGDDLTKMLSSLDIPSFIKSETNIIVSSEKKTLQKDLKVFQARRVFTGFNNTSIQLLGINLTKQLGC